MNRLATAGLATIAVSVTAAWSALLIGAAVWLVSG